jgi:hypothetical protein
MAVMNLPHSMTVERLVANGAIKEAYSSRPGTIACFLQPELPVENQAAIGGQMTKSSRCFVDYTANVKPKDRVTIDGKKYNVAGVREHQYGSWPHKVLSLEAI